MARNQVMKLWSTIVTVFLALCTALGLITTTAAAAVSQPEPAGNTSSTHVTPPTVSRWSWAYAGALPPTMKQRIHAEAHGKSPSCRLRPLSDADDCADTDVEIDPYVSVPEPATPLQR
jgi:hypothetical protein